jgi:putative PIN family toxin of toxin-antitoxin system
VRAVLDPNVLVSALLSRHGAPARIVERWLAGEFELVASEALLTELERTLAYPRLRSRVPAEEAAGFIALLRNAALSAADPENPPQRSPDPGDDDLLALAEAEQAVLVSGDGHLLGLASRFPIESPRGFLEVLERLGGD